MLIKQIVNIIKNNIKLKKVGKHLGGLGVGYFLSFANRSSAGVPNERLLSLSSLAIERANLINLNDVEKLFTQEYAGEINNWPGEHYRLLSAITDILKPNIIIEIGTHKGASALAIKKFISDDAKIITYDIVPWKNFKDTGLKEADFDLKLEQRIVDLTKTENSEQEKEMLESADLIFVDAAKDGKMEKIFCELFDKINFKNKPIVIFDDIRMLNMIQIWNEIKYPKLDLTSFGHWSGTGIVEWS